MRRQLSLAAAFLILGSLASAADARTRAPGTIECTDHRGCFSTGLAREHVRSATHRPAHRAHRAAPGPRHAGLAAIRSVNGRVAYVAASAAGRFQAFIHDLEATGYRIGVMGGWRRHGSCRGCNMHPRGLALDIDQVARNRTTRQLPGSVSAIAARHGLLHGAVWRNPDAGHFEVAGHGAGGWPQALIRRRSYATALPQG